MNALPLWDKYAEMDSASTTLAPSSVCVKKAMKSPQMGKIVLILTSVLVYLGPALQAHVKIWKDPSAVSALQVMRYRMTTALILMNVMRNPTSVSLEPVVTPLAASSAFVLQDLSCLIMGVVALILVRVSASRSLIMESAQCLKPSTLQNQSAAVAQWLVRAGEILVSSVLRKELWHFRNSVHMVWALYLTLEIPEKMSMNVQRTLEFASMESVLIQMALSDVNAHLGII